MLNALDQLRLDQSMSIGSLLLLLVCMLVYLVAQVIVMPDQSANDYEQRTLADCLLTHLLVCRLSIYIGSSLILLICSLS